MERLKRKQQINGYPLEWMGENKISDLKKDLEELEKMGAEYVDIDLGYSSDYVSFTASYYRDETDKELAIRIEHEEKSKSRRQAFERAEYERLKQKFENS